MESLNAETVKQVTDMLNTPIGQTAVVVLGTIFGWQIAKATVFRAGWYTISTIFNLAGRLLATTGRGISNSAGVLFGKSNLSEEFKATMAIGFSTLLLSSGVGMAMFGLGNYNELKENDTSVTSFVCQLEDYSDSIGKDTLSIKEISWVASNTHNDTKELPVSDNQPDKSWSIKPKSKAGSLSMFGIGSSIVLASFAFFILKC